MASIKDVIQNEFVKKGYLIPTDNIRQQSDEVLFAYIEAMRNGAYVPTIKVCNKDHTRIGEKVLFQYGN